MKTRIITVLIACVLLIGMLGATPGVLPAMTGTLSAVGAWGAGSLDRPGNSLTDLGNDDRDPGTGNPLDADARLNDALLNAGVRSDSALEKLTAEDELWVIIEFEGDSVLDDYLHDNRGCQTLTAFAASDRGQDCSQALRQNQDNALESLRADIGMEIKYHYTTLLNGVAARIAYGDLERLENSAGVKKVIIAEQYAAPLTADGTLSAVETVFNVYKTGIYNTSGMAYTGKGMLVAVLDTGLDYTHTAFAKDPAGPYKLTRDDVADLIASTEAAKLCAGVSADDVYVSPKIPYMFDYSEKDADVYPFSDHGTHVAGIIAGNDDEVTGVSIDAQLAIMKVFPDSNLGASTVDILAALSDCVTIGADVINMSLGTSSGFSRETDDSEINKVYDKVKEAGISLMCAASNDYSSAMGSEKGNTNLTSNPDSGTVGSPSTYDAALSIGSISGTKTPYLLVNGTQAVYIKDGNNTAGDECKFIETLLDGATHKTFEYVTVPGLGASGDYIGLDVKGKIALVKRGTSSFEDKVNTATAKGAIGVIVYNNVSGTISMSVGNHQTIPSCSTTLDAGSLMAQQASGTIEVSVAYMAGPFMDEFSSWGVTPDLQLKPEIVAHGGNIYSAVRGGYDTFSGTSMATPNLAGAMLLLRQRLKADYPTYTDRQVATLADQIMMSTASIALNEEGNPYSPRKQGAGLADIQAMMRTFQYITVDGSGKTKLSLGDDKNKTGVYTLEFNLVNDGSEARAYRVRPYVMTESVSADGKTVTEHAYMFNDAKIQVWADGETLSGNAVSVRGKSAVKMKVQITLSDADKTYLDEKFENGMFVEGFIHFEELNGGDTATDLTIPYVAFWGDWAQAPLLDADAYAVGASQVDSAVLEKDKLKEDVYASIPMGTFQYGGSSVGYWGIGEYGYNLADGYEKPATLMEHAALSYNKNANYAIDYVYLGLLRGCSEIHAEVIDNVTGQVVYEKTAENVRKSYYSGGRRPGLFELGLNAASQGLINNRSYTVNIVCTPATGNAESNKKTTFTFTFTCDNDAPVLVEDMTQLRIEKDNKGNLKYYVDVYVYDNAYLQAYSAGTTVNGTFTAFFSGTVPVDSAFDANNKITLDVTDQWESIVAAGETMTMTFYDYAKNYATFTVKIPQVHADEIGFTKKANYDEAAGVHYVVIKPNQLFDYTDFLALTPTVARQEYLTWTSEDEGVVRANAGKLLGVAEGEADVIIADPVTGATSRLRVRVSGKAVTKTYVENLRFTAALAPIEQGTSHTVSVVLDPWYSRDDDITYTWSTSRDGIISVTPDEKDPTRATIKGLDEGTVTVYVAATYYDAEKGTQVTSNNRAKLTVTVKEMFDIESRVLKNYYGTGDENGVVRIPEDEGIVYIYQACFFGKAGIKKVIVPEGVEEIQMAAFYNMPDLEEVVLPSTCKILDEWAFGWSKKLTTINLEHVTTMDNYAFYNCQSLRNIDLSNLRIAGQYCFANNLELTTVDITNLSNADMAMFANCIKLNTVVTGPNTCIGNYMFYNNISLENIVLYARNIGEYAFAQCSSLASVTLVNPVNRIGDRAFFYCTNLGSVNILSTVQSIGEYAFSYAGFTAFELPDGLQSVGFGAFYYSALDELYISAGCDVSKFDYGILYKTDVSAVQVSAGNPYFTSKDGILYNKSMDTLVLYPSGKTGNTNFTVPATVNTIGSYAMAGAYVFNLNLNRVTKLSEGALYGSRISTVVMDSVTYIGDFAFTSCTALGKIVIPDGVTYIGDGAFAGCTRSVNTYALTIPDSVTYLGHDAFRQVGGIKEITIGKGVTELPLQVFAQCSKLETVVLPEGLTYIDESAFASCVKLSRMGTDAKELVEGTVRIPDSVTGFGKGVFYGCNAMTEVYLPNNEAFDTLTEGTFMDCFGLTDVHIPETLKTLEYAAFSGCKALQSIDLCRVETLGESSFLFTDLAEISSDYVRVIDDGVFYYNQNLKSVSFPNATSVGSLAFVSCPALEKVVLTSVESIGSSAFNSLTKLTTVDLPAIKTIDNSAFANCTGLTKVTLGDSLEKIAPAAFANTALESIVIPASLTELGHNAFSGVTTLRTITVSPQNKSFYTDAAGVLYQKLEDGGTVLKYAGTYVLETFYEIPEGTRVIDAGAFSNNRKIVTVVLPESLTHIGYSAFRDSNVVTYIARGLDAPVLETLYDSKINANYDNFKGALGEVTGLRLIIGNRAEGYSNYVWQTFFPHIERVAPGDMESTIAAEKAAAEKTNG